MKDNYYLKLIRINLINFEKSFSLNKFENDYKQDIYKLFVRKK